MRGGGHFRLRLKPPSFWDLENHSSKLVQIESTAAAYKHTRRLVYGGRDELGETIMRFPFANIQKRIKKI